MAESKRPIRLIMNDIPANMEDLRTTEEGYPIPYITLMDDQRRPHFGLTDDNKVKQCLRETRCGVCGKGINKSMWWVGGAAAAYHETGSYTEPGMHRSCMEFMMKVCPYFAEPDEFWKDRSFEEKTVMIGGLMTVLKPAEVERTPIFFAVSHMEQQVLYSKGDGSIVGIRPRTQEYERIQLWRDGTLVADFRTPEDIEEHTRTTREYVYEMLASHAQKQN